MNYSEDYQYKVVGGGTAKLQGNINMFNVFGHLVESGLLNSVFDSSDIYPYCLLSRHYFEEFKKKIQGQTIGEPLPKDLPDTVKTLGPICSISLAYETPNFSGPSWQDTFIVVEHIPVPKDISIVFTRKIHDKLEILIDQRHSHNQESQLHYMKEVKQARLKDEKENGDKKEGNEGDQKEDKGDGEATKEKNEEEWVIVNPGDYLYVGNTTRWLPNGRC
jgi:hypothetical protein